MDAKSIFQHHSADDSDSCRDEVVQKIPEQMRKNHRGPWETERIYQVFIYLNDAYSSIKELRHKAEENYAYHEEAKETIDATTGLQY